MATDADSGLRDESRRRALSVTGTAALALALVVGWVVVYFIGLVGALWRFREPHAPAPILTMHDQWTDLAVGALQVVVGAIAIGAVYLARRRTLPAVMPLRHGSAREAALTWCAAIGAASAIVLVLSRLNIVRFGFSIPASVESD
ncbi:hypothetical protein QNA19_08365 [Rhodococcus fascians]|nr:hypothetical protein [Rhodococcus fascians]MDJ0425928.1 hypothetical protein [Rhodococcus fascians]